MKLLLDTVTMLWIASDDRQLSAAARSAYEDDENQAVISVVSIWEILVKYRLGKLPLPRSLNDMIF